MSLDIVRKNSGSPFHLQRSIVDRGEGGAYETGGFNPKAGYSDGGMSEVITQFGKSLGSALSNVTAEDRNNADLRKKARLDKREKGITDNAWVNADNDHTVQRERDQRKLDRIHGSQSKTNARIDAYNEIQKPTLKSDVASKKTPVNVNSKVNTTPTIEENPKNSFNIGSQLKTDYSINANLKTTKYSGPKEDYILGKGPQVGIVKKPFKIPTGYTF